MSFTHGGLGGNDDMAVLILDADHGAGEAIDRIRATFDGYWDAAKALI